MNARNNTLAPANLDIIKNREVYATLTVVCSASQTVQTDFNVTIGDIIYFRFYGSSDFNSVSVVLDSLEVCGTLEEIDTSLGFYSDTIKLT